MSLLHIKIFGKSVDDQFIFKLLLGVICIGVLLILVGPTEFQGWVVKSLVIWVAVTMIVVTMLYFFVEETISMAHGIMLLSGAIILVVFAFFVDMPLNILLISIFQSLAWMTIFSLILDSFKRRITR